MKPFIERYPRFFAASPEFCDLQQALEQELLSLWDARDSALLQLCAETADWGLTYWEQTLGIPVNTSDNLGSRRSRIRTKLLGATVTTLEAVRHSAEICSGAEAEVKEYAPQFRVEIAFTGTSGIPPNLKALSSSLREIMPAHLVWGFAFFLELEASVQIGGMLGEERTLDIWPQIENELESSGGVTPMGALESCALLEIYPVTK